MVDIIPLDLVVDVVVLIAPHVVVIVVTLMILMEVAQIVPLPLNLKDDMNNSLVNLLQCQQRMQSDTTYSLQVTHQSQQDHTDDSLLGEFPTFDGKP